MVLEALFLPIPRVRYIIRINDSRPVPLLTPTFRYMTVSSDLIHHYKQTQHACLDNHSFPMDLAMIHKLSNTYTLQQKYSLKQPPSFILMDICKESPLILESSGSILSYFFLLLSIRCLSVILCCSSGELTICQEKCFLIPLFSSFVPRVQY